MDCSPGARVARRNVSFCTSARSRRGPRKGRALRETAGRLRGQAAVRRSGRARRGRRMRPSLLLAARGWAGAGHPLRREGAGDLGARQECQGAGARLRPRHELPPRTTQAAARPRRAMAWQQRKMRLRELVRELWPTPAPMQRGPLAGEVAGLQGSWR